MWILNEYLIPFMSVQKSKFIECILFLHNCIFHNWSLHNVRNHTVQGIYETILSDKYTYSPLEVYSGMYG
jgi:hypothetical protein